MRNSKSARRDRRARLEQRISGRIPREPGRALDPERRLRGLVDLEPDAPPSQGLADDISRRLGPKGRFLAAAIVIGGIITGATLAWERFTSSTAVSADHTNAALVGLGHTLYDQQCAYCHGVDLKGKPGWDGDYPSGGRPALPLDGTAPIWRLSDTDMFDVTKYGGQPFSPPVYKNDMPAFEDQLADADIWAILAYVKSHWSEEVHNRQTQPTDG